MDWDDVPEPCVREVLRQGEATLGGTLEMGIGADQRATTICGIFGGAAIALFATAATIIASSDSFSPLLWSSLAAAVPLFIASLLCGHAGRPIDFHVAGYEPKLLLPAAKDEAWLLRYVAEDVQARIDFNRRALERSARLITMAFKIAALAVFSGIVVFFSTF